MMEDREEDEDFEYTAGMDIADSIAFFIICALVLLVVLQ
jgi:hypothetical protein